MLEFITSFVIFSCVKTADHTEQIQPECIVPNILAIKHSDSGISNQVGSKTDFLSTCPTLQQFNNQLNQIFLRNEQSPDTHKIVSHEKTLNQNPSLENHENQKNKFHVGEKQSPDTHHTINKPIYFDKMKDEKCSEIIIKKDEALDSLKQSEDYYSQINGKKTVDRKRVEFSTHLQKNMDKIKIFSEEIWNNYGWIKTQNATIDYLKTRINANIFTMKNEPSSTHEFLVKGDLEKLLGKLEKYLYTSKKFLIKYFKFISEEKLQLEIIYEDIRNIESSNMSSTWDFDFKPFLKTIEICINESIKEIEEVLKRIQKEKIFVVERRNNFFLERSYN